MTRDDCHIQDDPDPLARTVDFISQPWFNLINGQRFVVHVSADQNGARPRLGIPGAMIFRATHGPWSGYDRPNRQVIVVLH